MTRPTFHVRDSFNGVERAISEREWENVSRDWREARANAFSPADAEAAEAAVGARKGAGLVSVSTTTTLKRRRAEPLSLVHRARAERRAEDEKRPDGKPGVYVPPSDGDSMRVRHLRRAVGFAARAQAVAEKGRRSDQVRMLTLTYARGGDWRASHVRELLNVLRSWLRRRKVALRYVWVAELQKRGVIHYHIAFWLPYGFKLPMPDVCGWWPHGSSNIELARNAVPYLMKYLSKGCDKAGCWRLPEGARMYGIGGLDHALRRARRWLGLPAFVRARSDLADDWRRVEGGGWASPDGEWFPAEYQRARVGPFLAFERINDHGRPFEADGPFSWVRGQ